MKTIKIIDLLNKIANGDTPQKIRHLGTTYIFDEYRGDWGYVNKSTQPYKWFFKEFNCDLETDLNSEVEIIDDEVEIKIPTIDDMKNIGEKVGKAYRELFEGFNKGWNTSTEKEIEKIKSNGIDFYSDCINVWISKEETVAYCEFLMNKVNEVIDAVNEMRKEK